MPFALLQGGRGFVLVLLQARPSRPEASPCLFALHEFVRRPKHLQKQANKQVQRFHPQFRRKLCIHHKFLYLV